MGTFIYDSRITANFEDRLLAHLQAVIVAKVRRGEAFHFTWKDDVSTGGGRTTVYVHPGVSMVFTFQGEHTPPVDQAWLHALAFNANSTRGLYIVPEPSGLVRASSPMERMVFSEAPASDPIPQRR